MTNKAKLRAVVKAYAEKAREAAAYFDYAYAVTETIDEGEVEKVLATLTRMGLIDEEGNIRPSALSSLGLN